MIGAGKICLVLLVLGVTAIGCSPLIVSKPWAPWAEGKPYSLPKTALVLKVGVTEKKSEGGVSFPVSLSVDTKRIPDPEMRFLLEYNRDPLFTDDLKVTFTKEGFLESITATTEDATPEIARSVAATAISLAKFQIASGAESMGTLSHDLSPEAFARGVEQYIAVRIAEALRKLANVDKEREYSAFLEDQTIEVLSPFIALVVDVTGSQPGAGSKNCDRSKSSSTGTGEKSKKAINGVFARSVEPCRIDVKLIAKPKVIPGLADSVQEYDSRKKSKLESQVLGDVILAQVSTVAVVPDFSEASRIPLDRHMLVKTDHGVVFSDGVLVKSTLNRPSSWLSLAKVPEDVAEKLANLPAEIVQLKLNIATQAAKLADEQVKVLEAQRKLEVAQQSSAVQSEIDLMNLEKNRIEAEKALLAMQKELFDAQKQLDELKKKLNEPEGGG